MAATNVTQAALQSAGHRASSERVSARFQTYPSDRDAAWRLMLTAAVLYTAYLTYLTIGLDFSLYRSDVLAYWQESLRLKTPSIWWVPGYPLLIACVRTLTSDVLSPTAVMVLISGVAYVVGVLLVAAIAVDLKLARPERVALIFAAYPFVGLTYSVWPVSDTFATMLLLGCYLAFERRRWTAFAALAAWGLMAHKAMWFFIPCLMVLAVLRHRESRLIVPLACVPLLTWLGWGAVHYGDLWWFARWPVKHLVISRSELIFFDGLAGPFLQGGVVKTAKGIVIVTIVAAAVLCGYVSVRSRFLSGLALTVPIVVLAVVLNQYEVWAVVRFSRVLVIPLAYVASTRPAMHFVLESRPVYGSLLVASVASNLAYGVYMSDVFFQ